MCGIGGIVSTNNSKIDQNIALTCPVPNDGEKLQVCSWRNEDKGEFKSSFKESHGNRVR